jgi:hypothetical protein
VVTEYTAQVKCRRSFAIGGEGERQDMCGLPYVWRNSLTIWAIAGDPI